MSASLLEARGLEKTFLPSSTLGQALLRRLSGGTERTIHAVDGVDIRLEAGSLVGVIGESGCGKTTLLKTLMGLYTPSAGEILFEGEPTSEYGKREWQRFRRNVQIVFQDPYNALNPKLTVREQVREPLAVHGIGDRDERIREALTQVELNPPDQYLGQLPTSLSGGERQRVSLARALVLEPEVLLADEPVSMLDVSTQAALLKLMKRLNREQDLSILYISHDLSTVSYLCEEVNVMYLGRVIERAPTERLVSDPKHPYTQALIQAIPLPDPYAHRERTRLSDTPADPIDLPGGCRFKDRCPERMDVCEREPPLLEHPGGQAVACHLYDEDVGDEPAGAAATPGNEGAR